MATKTSGAEWKRFYNDRSWWPEDVYHDDTVVVINGCRFDASEYVNLDEVADDDEIIIEYGYMYGLNDSRTLEEHFLAWRRTQTHTVLVVSVPNERLQAVRQAVEAAGGTIQG